MATGAAPKRCTMHESKVEVNGSTSMSTVTWRGHKSHFTSYGNYCNHLDNIVSKNCDLQYIQINKKTILQTTSNLSLLQQINIKLYTSSAVGQAVAAGPGSIPGREKFPGWRFSGFSLTYKTNVGKL